MTSTKYPKEDINDNNNGKKDSSSSDEQNMSCFNVNNSGQPISSDAYIEH